MLGFIETVFWVFVIGIAVCFVIGIIIGLCEDAASSSSSSNSSSSSSSSKPKSSKPSGSYTNTDIYGIPNSTTYIDDEDDIITHVSTDGDIKTSTSFDINDLEKIHFGLDGSFLGSTKQTEDGKIELYDSDNLYDGYLKVNENGTTIDHYDKWGLYIGSSKK